VLVVVKLEAVVEVDADMRGKERRAVVADSYFRTFGQTIALGEVRTDGLGLWVPPVRRGSTEGVTAALTRPL
jgi:hypothetical protein